MCRCSDAEIIADVSVHVGYYTYIYIPELSTEDSDTPVATSIPGFQILVSKCHSPTKGTRTP